MNSEEEAEDQDQEDDTMTDESNPSATKKARIATEATSIKDSKIETQVKKTTPIVRCSSRARKKVIAYVAGPAAKVIENTQRASSKSTKTSVPVIKPGRTSAVHVSTGTSSSHNSSIKKKARIATDATPIEDSKIQTHIKKPTPIVRGSSRTRKKVSAYVAGPASAKISSTRRRVSIMYADNQWYLGYATPSTFKSWSWSVVFDEDGSEEYFKDSATKTDEWKWL